MGSNIYETMGNTLIHLRLKNFAEKTRFEDIAKAHSGHYLVKKNKTFSENVVYKSSTMLPSVTNAYDGSIQILLNLTQFITLGTESNLEGFVWNHQSEMGLVSPRQFAPQC